MTTKRPLVPRLVDIRLASGRVVKGTRYKAVAGPGGGSDGVALLASKTDLQQMYADGDIVQAEDTPTDERAMDIAAAQGMLRRLESPDVSDEQRLTEFVSMLGERNL